jgi:hypothetical protein
MKLICGMPRSGTKYLLNMFSLYGINAIPKIYCHNSDFNSSWSTNEAEAISYAHYKGVEGYSIVHLFNTLNEVWQYDKTDDMEIMYKQPQLCFMRKELMFFSEIIICKRPVDSWVKSVRVHVPASVYVQKSTRPAWLKKYEDRFTNSPDPYKTLGEIWEENTNDLIKFLEIRKMRYHVCEFGNIEHYRKLFIHFGFSEQIVENCLRAWAGSNTDSNYKPF